MRIMYDLTKHENAKADLIRALIVETGNAYSGFTPFEKIEPGLEAIYAKINEEPGMHHIGAYTLSNRGCLRGPDNKVLVGRLEGIYGFIPVSEQYRDPEPEVEIFSGPLTADTQLFFTDLIKKHDELAKMMQFTTTESLQWLEEGREGVEGIPERIYAWDPTGNYHEISIERADATTDNCQIRFNRRSDGLAINVNWRQEA